MTMIDPEQLMRLVQLEVERLVARWNQTEARVVAPQVRFYPRGLAAGKASTDGKRVGFHLGLMAVHWQEYPREIIAHEVAHAIAFQLHGRRIRPHGREWRTVGKILGFALEVTHGLDARSFKARRTRYVELATQAGDSLWVTAARYRRARRRRETLILCRSGERLYPTGREKWE